MYHVVGPAPRKWILNKSTANQTASPVSVNTVTSAIWHSRLGHLSPKRHSLLSQLFPYVSYDFNHSHVCDICQKAKQRHFPFVSSFNNAKENFELIHFDIWGPFHVTSLHGHRYFLTVLDDHSRFCWVYLLKSKAEVSGKVQSFIHYVKIHFNAKVKYIRSDNGPEFTMNKFYELEGIVHQTSCRETPQQNGRVERKHQHILNVARALLFQSNLPKTFWTYAVTHAVFLINRIPTQLLANKSPFEVLHGASPDYSVLRSFGCLCYVATLLNHRHKFDSRANASVFLGYKQGTKGYVVYVLRTREITVSREVVFDESNFPYHSKQPHITQSPDQTTSGNSPFVIIPDLMISDVPQHIEPETAASSEQRIRKAPRYLQDYHCYQSIAGSPQPSHPKVTHPIQNSLSYNQLSKSHQDYHLSQNLKVMPKLASLNVGSRLCKMRYWP